MENILEMRAITKAFSKVVASDNVNFELKKGEVHVLLGENGAGKTTLMNILYGLYNADSGDIYLKGRKVQINTPADAIQNGIGMVHQHFMLVNKFTVVENIILGSEPRKGLSIDFKKAQEDAGELIRRYGFNIEINSKVGDISVGQQQKVEIIKALYRGADILILDEPTAVLTPSEIDELKVIIKNLTSEGKSVILITHKLKEVMSMSDRVTIIRRGKVIDTVNTNETNIEKLAEMMVGRKVNLKLSKSEAVPGDTILQVQDLYINDHRELEALKGVNFTVHSGEVLGIAGVDGNGQKELVEGITGLRRIKSGKVIVKGLEVTNKTPEEIIDSGVSHIPEDRHKRGLILGFSIAENSILGMHKNKLFTNKTIMDYGKIKEFSKKIIEEFDIRTSSEDIKASLLSGGNQQKIVVGREISKNPDLIIAMQPTRGLDVGAIEYIHKRLVAERDKGRAILLVSFELDEILALSDRIAVMYEGKISGILDVKEATEQKLGLLMAGGTL